MKLQLSTLTAAQQSAVITAIERYSDDRDIVVAQHTLAQALEALRTLINFTDAQRQLFSDAQSAFYALEEQVEAVQLQQMLEERAAAEEQAGDTPEISAAEQYAQTRDCVINCTRDTLSDIRAALLRVEVSLNAIERSEAALTCEQLATEATCLSVLAQHFAKEAELCAEDCSA